MIDRMTRALIVGGGIGGLAAALSLHRAGVEVEVHEQADEVRELGVGINVLPSAIAVLADLGLLDALVAAGIETHELLMTTRRGELIWRERRGLAAGHGVPQVSIHRGRLQGILAEALRQRVSDCSIHLGHRLAGFADSDEGVVARFVDRAGHLRSETSAAALIGADGIHSTVRRLLFPAEGPPRWNGSMLWRGATTWPAFLDGRSMIVAGGMSGKFVVYPIAVGPTPRTRLTNWGVVAPLARPGATPPRREDWSRPAHRPDVEAFVTRFTSGVVDVARLVAATEEIFEYPLCDRDPLDRWSHGRVTMLGDAAHPMFPMGSNGATQAIIDGDVLATHLGAPGGEVVEALGRYEQERAPATARLVALNRAGGPERVIDLVESMAPDGFAHIDDVIAADELRSIVNDYARATGRR
jgi:2-polyprenyl-6-methoxyphenol hydroxylase-like FAD-dependent oxidoreductase